MAYKGYDNLRRIESFIIVWAKKITPCKSVPTETLLIIGFIKMTREQQTSNPTLIRMLYIKVT